MTEQRPTNFDGERRQTDELAPENENAEQRDSDAQSHTVAGEAQDRETAAFALEDSEKLETSFDTPEAQDLVDHMNQMHRSGTIDMSAYAGEPNHDDNVDKFGPRSKLDGLRGDGT
ncbi:MAG: hypothetical protein EON93_20965 [Burkholderiales bacterium]|nr:MAG: hypothetical protein EON93_20965 [Burkholderiales bacterium]